MKLLTLNTHSLIEENYENNLAIFTDAIAEIKPDIIALQEVNQTASRNNAAPSSLIGNVYHNFDIPIKEDNHALRVSNILRQKGINYNWIWLPIKNGYKMYDEGIAIFSHSPIVETDTILLTNNDDYHNWRTRKVIGIKAECGDWYYSAHFGWWDDEDTPFEKQWHNFLQGVSDKGNVTVAGDFNTTPNSKGYDLILDSEWFDYYNEAKLKDNGITVSGEIAGWSDNLEEKRIDYVFSNYKRNVKSSYVIFNGVNKGIVSDHFGIITEF